MGVDFLIEPRYSDRYPISLLYTLRVPGYQGHHYRLASDKIKSAKYNANVKSLMSLTSCTSHLVSLCECGLLHIPLCLDNTSACIGRVHSGQPLSAVILGCPSSRAGLW